MRALIWMLVIALGFMTAGALLWELEWKIGLALFCGTWLWMAMPKAAHWSCRAIGSLFVGRNATEVKN